MSRAETVTECMPTILVSFEDTWNDKFSVAESEAGFRLMKGLLVTSE